jgi:16S rRNA (adenine1518-N6/adenine1519-N6)-dimethyltransferase
MRPVKPKKHLGQHFLKDQSIAERIAQCVQGHGGYRDLLEVGPGTGVLTQYLRTNPNFDLRAVELDSESVDYLLSSGMLRPEQLIAADFLQLPIDTLFEGPFGIVGNFPYNISSQIFFKAYEYRHVVQEVVGMVQKEVGERIVAGPGGKVGGILSILMQAFYDVSYEFTVPPEVFDPPPKVQSAVISLRRNNVTDLGCSESLFRSVVKQGFNMRRKTLRNALKPLNPHASISSHPYFDKRAEQLSVDDFIILTKLFEDSSSTAS